MACSKTNFFYVSKNVTIRGYISKPKGETLLCCTVPCIERDVDELQKHAGKTVHILSTLGGKRFMVCASRCLTSTVELCAGVANSSSLSS